MSIERSSGVLLPISSLPSNYGIGTLGKKAYEFVDMLVKAGQSYWQVLPVGQTGYGDSPYQSFSSFAGNPYFIDLDMLLEEGMLEKEDLENLEVEDKRHIDYGKIYNTRYVVLRKAYEREIEKERTAFERFLQENASWLDSYTLYMAVKKHFGNASWVNWPEEDIRLRKEGAIYRYKELLRDEIRFYSFVQYLFFKQYAALKKYANEKGIRIIGDLPIYVSMDSADVWAEPEQFQLDEETYLPKEVSGVPPDYFSKTGQLWGNPLYNWDHMKKDGYGWWIRRVSGTARYFDVIRIDHFRGFAQYWAVPYGEKTAINGCWKDGPGSDFVSVLKNWFNNVEFIAEDLGIIDEKVSDLLKFSGFPGMRVLEFGIDKNGKSYHAPHHHIKNCVCYVGTHDNAPCMGWIKNASKLDLGYAKRYYGLNHSEGYNFGFIRGGMSSVAELFIAQMQDYLGLGADATINTPGTLGNWTWRMLDGEFTEKLSLKIRKITERYGRLVEKPEKPKSRPLSDYKKEKGVEYRRNKYID